MSGCERDREYRVGAESLLIGRAIERNKRLVDTALIPNNKRLDRELMHGCAAIVASSHKMRCYIGPT